MKRILFFLTFLITGFLQSAEKKASKQLRPTLANLPAEILREVATAINFTNNPRQAMRAISSFRQVSRATRQAVTLNEAFFRAFLAKQFECSHANPLTIIAELEKAPTPNELKKSVFNLESCCKLDLIQRLIDAGYDVSIKDEEGRNLLMVAAQQGNTQIIDMLLASGVPIDALDNMRNTALFYAVKFGNKDAAQLLINAGASLGIADMCGWKVSTWAVFLLSVSQRFKGVVELLESTQKK